MRKNIKKLITTKTNENLSCIHGIRVLTMVWIIFGHTIEWADWNLYSKISEYKIFHFLSMLSIYPFIYSGNTFKMKEILSSPEKQIFLRGHYCVESFFFIRQSNIHKINEFFKLF